MRPKTILSLVGFAVFVVILLQNMDGTPIQVLFWEIRTPLLILILISMFLGWTFGWFTHVAYRRGKGRNAEGRSHANVREVRNGTEVDSGQVGAGTRQTDKATKT